MNVLHYATVVEVTESGMIVESPRNGVVAKYGPMLYISPVGVPLTFTPGDRVLIGQVGRIADQFIILGKVMDPIVPAYNQPQDPFGGGTP